jgi:hypothetical protein
MGRACRKLGVEDVEGVEESKMQKTQFQDIDVGESIILKEILDRMGWYGLD